MKKKPPTVHRIRAYVMSKSEVREEHVHKTLEAETPRARILIAAEYVSELLDGLLRSVMASTESADSLLKGFHAPLGTLSTRIEAARAFGLISEDDYFNFGQLNKVRNHCAHHIGEIRPDDQKVVAHFRNFRLPDHYLAERAEMFGTELSPDIAQLFTLSFLIAWLQAVAEAIEDILSKKGSRGVRAWFLGSP